MTNYYTLLTPTGLAKITNAQITQGTVAISHLAVGDSGGTNYAPTGKETALKSEKWRGGVSSVKIDSVNPNWIVVEAILPATVGGFTLREVALYDVDGDMIAVGNYPDTYKPILSDGSTMDLVLRTIIEVSSTDSVSLKIDPNVIVASRKYVDDSMGLINDEVTAMQKQVTETESKVEEKVTDLTTIHAKSSPKILYRQGNSEYNIVSKKPSKKGFTMFKFTKGSGVAADDYNYGTNYDLLRLTAVYDVTKALVYQQPTSYVSSQLHTTGSNDFNFHNFATDYGLPSQIQFISNNLKTAKEEYIEFNMNIKRAHNGFIHLAFYGTVGSCDALGIYVNNTLIKTASLVDSAKIKIIPVNVSEYFGDVTIKLKIASTATNTSVHFAGFNAHDLSEASDNLEYNKAAYTVSGNHYISLSAGANDYALQENGGKWLGSYHGGETALSLQVIADGSDYTNMAVGTYTIVKKLEILQSTNLINKITTQSITRLYFDSTFELDCRFEVISTFNVSNFFVTMTCSNPSFSQVIYPIKATTTSLDQDTALPNVLRVVQLNPTTLQTITTMHNLLKWYKGTPARISTAPQYCKVYHGQIVKSSANIENVNFSTIKIFD